MCFLAAVVCASAQNQNAGFLQNLLNDLGKWREQGQNAFNQGQQQLQSAFRQGQQQLQNAFGQNGQNRFESLRQQGQGAFIQGQQQLQSAFEQSQQQLQSAFGQGKQHIQQFGQTAQNGFNGALNHGRQFFNGLNPSANSNGKPSL